MEDIEYILTQKQMRALDKHAIDKMGISGLFLMEQAAREVCKEIMRAFPEGGRSVLIVVESGNNGGDGLALARLLKEHDYSVTVYHINDIDSKSDSFKEQLRLAEEKDIMIIESLPAEENYDLVVDAIFGVGLKRNIKGAHRRAIEWMNRLNSFKVAIDIPSGVNATTGAIMGCAFKADMTVTFGYRKLGMVLYPGSDMIGQCKVRDIGFPEESLWHVKPYIVSFGEGNRAAKRAIKYCPKRYNYSHKGSYGNVLMVVGSKGMAGAAVFAAKAAYLSGCGLVRIITHESNRLALQINVPEAVVLPYKTLDEAYALLDDNWHLSDAVLVGSGIGRSDVAAALTRSVITYASQWKKAMPVVVDGDSLSILGENSEIWQYYGTLPEDLRNYLTLTPHLREMSRLCGKEVEDIKGNLLLTVNSYIKSLNLAGSMTVVLKDARTFVTDGNRITYINMTGNHGMATAGSGDCLAGMLVSLLAQNQKNEIPLLEGNADARNRLLPTFENSKLVMAMAAVALHGCAGNVAKYKAGTISMMATDILEGIPEVMKKYDVGGQYE